MRFYSAFLWLTKTLISILLKKFDFSTSKKTQISNSKINDLKWLPEIKKFYEDVPVLLVGTKHDLKQKLKENKLNKSELNNSTLSENNKHLDKKKISNELTTLTNSIHNQLNKSKAQPTSQDIKRPLSIISKVSAEEIFKKSDLNEHGTNDENFKQILNKLNSIPTFLTLNEFVKLSLIDEDVSDKKSELNNDLTELNESEFGLNSKLYVSKKQVTKLKDSINSKFYFKTSSYDINSIRFLMDKAVLTAINYHLKRDKASLKQSNGKLNKMNLDCSMDSRHQLNLSNDDLLNKQVDSPNTTASVASVKHEQIEDVQSKEVKTSKSFSSSKKSNGSKNCGFNKFKCFSCTRSETSSSINQF